MERGYVKLWRRTLESGIWSQAPLVVKVWMYLLMSVNWRVGKATINGSEVTVQPGEIITSYRSIARGCAWNHRNAVVEPSVKEVRGAVDKLESAPLSMVQRIGQGVGQGYLHLKVLHWEVYQSPDSEVRAGVEAGVRAEVGQRSGTNQRSKEGKNEKERVAEIIAAIPKWKGKVGASPLERARAVLDVYSDLPLVRIEATARNLTGAMKANPKRYEDTPRALASWLNRDRNDMVTHQLELQRALPIAAPPNTATEDTFNPERIATWVAEYHNGCALDDLLDMCASDRERRALKEAVAE